MTMKQTNNITMQKYLDLYNQSQEKIANEQIISESLLKSLLLKLKHSDLNVNVRVYISQFFQDKKKKKKQFIEYMNETFFDDRIWTFSNITSAGFDSYGYYIYFTLDKNKQLYCLFIPYPENITMDTFSAAYYGQYHLTVEENGVYHVVCSSYKANDIKNTIKFMLD